LEVMEYRADRGSKPSISHLKLMIPQKLGWLMTSNSTSMLSGGFKRRFYVLVDSCLYEFEGMDIASCVFSKCILLRKSEFNDADDASLSSFSLTTKVGDTLSKLVVTPDEEDRGNFQIWLSKIRAKVMTSSSGASAMLDGMIGEKMALRSSQFLSEKKILEKISELALHDNFQIAKHSLRTLLILSYEINKHSTLLEIGVLDTLMRVFNLDINSGAVCELEFLIDCSVRILSIMTEPACSSNMQIGKIFF
jgi:hypothetical protein